MCLGVPGRVIERLGASEGLDYSIVEFDGLRCRVCTSCVPEAAPGDYVVVHAGIAISLIDAEQAESLLRELRELGAEEQVPHEVP